MHAGCLRWLFECRRKKQEVLASAKTPKERNKVRQDSLLAQSVVDECYAWSVRGTLNPMRPGIDH